MAKIDSIKVNINKEEIKNKTKKTNKQPVKKETVNKQTKKQEKKSMSGAMGIAVVITVIIICGALFSWQKNISEKNVNQIREEARGMETFIQKKLSDFENKLKGIESENVELKTANEELENKAKLLTDAKKEFSSSELGLNFHYPALFGEISLTISDGRTGKIFRGSFSNNDKLSFGGVSQDFSRSATTTLINILDTYGFKKGFVKYYFKYVSEQAITDYEIEPLDVIKSKSSVALVDKNSFVFDQENESQIISLGENHLAGLVNLEGDTFGGVAFLNQDVENFSLIEFGAMMEMVEVK